MGITFEHIREGLRFFKRAKKSGFTTYTGSAQEICKAIVAACWNGTYFQVSAGHFSEFYIRDLGWCAESLITLGQKDKVYQSMAWALDVYEKSNAITTTITPRNKAIDVFTLAPDSIAYVFRILRQLRAHDLIEKHKEFLLKQIKHYFLTCFDTDCALVYANKKFSSMKDNVYRQSSTYDNCMLSMLSHDLDFFELPNPFEKFAISDAIRAHLWNEEGGYFYDDMKKQQYIAGDANIFPFYCDVFTDHAMLERCIAAIQSAELDTPYPLKYTAQRYKKQELWPMKWFAPNYEGNSIWLHMGPLYVALVKEVDPAKAQQYKAAYTTLIESHSTFLELLNPDGSPYTTPFYKTDDSLLWAANYLTL